MRATRACLAAAALAAAAGGPAAIAGPTPLVLIQDACEDPWTEVGRAGDQAVCVYTSAVVAVFVDGSECQSYREVQVPVGPARICAL